MARVLIVGGGLSGLTAAAILCPTEGIEITLLEQGPQFDSRGETDRGRVEGLGGAGTRAGGKLCFPPASSGAWTFGNWTPSRFWSVLRKAGLVGSDIAFNMNVFLPTYPRAASGQYQSTLITRETFARFVRGLLEYIESNGVQVKADTRATSIRKTGLSEGFLVEARNGAAAFSLVSDYVIVATGRSSASTIRQLLPPEADVVDNAPDLGFRVSMPYEPSGPFSRVGRDPKIKRHYGKVGVRTFCVCSRGEATQVEACGLRYFDGHYGGTLTDTVDFGILARDEMLKGFDVVRRYCTESRRRFEGIDTLADFVHEVSQDKGDDEFGRLYDALARFVFDLSSSGWLSVPLDECSVSIPSVDRLNPRVAVDESCETAISGLYVVGDALGVSRGFLQSIWLGSVAAEEILACEAEAKFRMAV